MLKKKRWKILKKMEVTLSKSKSLDQLYITKACHEADGRLSHNLVQVLLWNPFPSSITSPTGRG